MYRVKLERVEIVSFFESTDQSRARLKVTDKKTRGLSYYHHLSLRGKDSMPTEYEDVLVNQPVVIDNGSGTIKAGFAGGNAPKSYFPNFVGRAKHQRVMAGTEDVDILIGKRAQELRGLLKIKYPMEHGIVTDWEDMEKIWQYVYAEELRTVPEEVNTSRRIAP
jgi:hypothetical protein